MGDTDSHRKALPTLAYVASPSPAKAKRRGSTAAEAQQKPLLSTDACGPLKLPNELFALATSRSSQGDLAITKALDTIQSVATRIETERAKLIIQSQELQIWDMAREEELVLLRAENEQLEQQLEAMRDKLSRGLVRDGVLDSLQFALRKARGERDAEVREADALFNQLQEARAAQQELRELRDALGAAVSGLGDDWSAVPLLEEDARELRAKVQAGARDPTKLTPDDMMTLLRGLVALASRGSELERETHTLRGEKTALQQALEAAQHQADAQAAQLEAAQALVQKQLSDGTQALMQAQAREQEPVLAQALQEAQAQAQMAQQAHYKEAEALRQQVCELREKLDEYRSFLLDNQQEIETLQNELKQLRQPQQLPQQPQAMQAAGIALDAAGPKGSTVSHAAHREHGPKSSADALRSSHSSLRGQSAGTATGASAAGSTASSSAAAAKHLSESSLHRLHMLKSHRSSHAPQVQAPPHRLQAQTRQLLQSQDVSRTSTRNLPSIASPISTVNYGGSPPLAGSPVAHGSPAHQRMAADIAHKVSELQDLALRAQQQAADREAEAAAQYELKLAALREELSQAAASEQAAREAQLSCQHAEALAQAAAEAAARESELAERHSTERAQELERQAAQLAAKHAAELEALQVRLAEAQAQHAHSLDELRQQLAAAAEQHRQAIAALREQLLAAEAQRAAEVMERERLLAERLHEREAELQRLHADALAEQEANAGLRMATALAEQAARLADEAALERRQLEDRLAAQLGEAVKSEAQERFAEDLLNRERELAARLTQEHAEHQARRDAELRAKHAERLAEQAAELAQLHAEQAAAAAAEAAAREAELMAQLSRREGELVEQIRALETSVTAAGAAAAAAAAAEREECESQLRRGFEVQLESELRQQRAELVAEAEAREVRIAEEGRKEAEARLAQQADAARLEFMREAARLAAEHDAGAQELLRQLQDEHALVADLRRQIAAMQAAADAAAAEVADAVAAAAAMGVVVPTAQATAAAAPDCAVPVEEDHGSGSSTGASSVAVAASEGQEQVLLYKLEQQLAERDEQLAELVQQHQARLEAAVAEGERLRQAAEAEVERRYIEVVAKLGREHEQAVAVARTAHELREANLRRALERLSGEAKEERRRLEESLQAAQGQLASLQAVLEEEQRRNDATVQAFQARIKQLAAELRTAAQREAHILAEVAELQEEVIRCRGQVTDAQAELHDLEEEVVRYQQALPLASSSPSSPPRDDDGSPHLAPPPGLAPDGTPASHGSASPHGSVRSAPHSPGTALPSPLMTVSPQVLAPEGRARAAASVPAGCGDMGNAGAVVADAGAEGQDPSSDVAEAWPDGQALFWPGPPVSLPPPLQGTAEPRPGFESAPQQAPHQPHGLPSDQAAAAAPCGSAHDLAASLLRALRLGPEGGGPGEGFWARTSASVEILPRQALLRDGQRGTKSKFRRRSSSRAGDEEDGAAFVAGGLLLPDSGSSGLPAGLDLEPAEAATAPNPAPAAVAPAAAQPTATRPAAVAAVAAAAGGAVGASAATAGHSSGAEGVGQDEEWGELQSAPPTPTTSADVEAAAAGAAEQLLAQAGGLVASGSGVAAQLSRRGGGSSSDAPASVSTTSSYNSETECHADDVDEDDGERHRALAAALAQSPRASAGAAAQPPLPPALQELQKRMQAKPVGADAAQPGAGAVPDLQQLGAGVGSDAASGEAKEPGGLEGGALGQVDELEATLSGMLAPQPACSALGSLPPRTGPPVADVAMATATGEGAHTGWELRDLEATVSGPFPSLPPQGLVPSAGQQGLDRQEQDNDSGAASRHGGAASSCMGGVDLGAGHRTRSLDLSASFEFSPRGRLQLPPLAAAQASQPLVPAAAPHGSPGTSPAGASALARGVRADFAQGTGRALAGATAPGSIAAGDTCTPSGAVAAPPAGDPVPPSGTDGDDSDPDPERGYSDSCARGRGSNVWQQGPASQSQPSAEGDAPHVIAVPTAAMAPSVSENMLFSPRAQASQASPASSGALPFMRLNVLFDDSEGAEEEANEDLSPPWSTVDDWDAALGGRPAQGDEDGMSQPSTSPGSASEEHSSGSSTASSREGSERTGGDCTSRGAPGALASSTAGWAAAAAPSPGAGPASRCSPGRYATTRTRGSGSPRTAAAGAAAPGGASAGAVEHSASSSLHGVAAPRSERAQDSPPLLPLEEAGPRRQRVEHPKQGQRAGEAEEAEVLSLLAAGASLGSSERRRRQRRRMADAPLVGHPLDLLRQSWEFACGVATPLSPRSATHHGRVQGQVVGHAPPPQPTAAAAAAACRVVHAVPTGPSDVGSGASPRMGVRLRSPRSAAGVGAARNATAVDLVSAAPAPDAPSTSPRTPHTAHAAASATLPAPFAASVAGALPSRGAASASWPLRAPQSAPSSATRGAYAAASAPSAFQSLSPREARQRGRAVLGRVLGRVALLESACRALATSLTPAATPGGQTPSATPSPAPGEAPAPTQIPAAPCWRPDGPTGRSVPMATARGPDGTEWQSAQAGAVGGRRSPTPQSSPREAPGGGSSGVGTGGGGGLAVPGWLTPPTRSPPSPLQSPQVAAGVVDALEELRGHLFELEKLHQLSLRGGGSATRGSAGHGVRVATRLQPRTRSPRQDSANAAVPGGSPQGSTTAQSGCRDDGEGGGAVSGAGSPARMAALSPMPLRPVSFADVTREGQEPPLRAPEHAVASPVSTPEAGPTNQTSAFVARPVQPSAADGDAHPSHVPGATPHTPAAPPISAPGERSAGSTLALEAALPAASSTPVAISPGMVQLLAQSIQAQLAGQLGQLQERIAELQQTNSTLLAASMAASAAVTPLPPLRGSPATGGAASSLGSAAGLTPATAGGSVGASGPHAGLLLTPQSMPQHRPLALSHLEAQAMATMAAGSEGGDARGLGGQDRREEATQAGTRGGGGVVMPWYAVAMADGVLGRGVPTDGGGPAALMSSSAGALSPAADLPGFTGAHMRPQELIAHNSTAAHLTPSDALVPAPSGAAATAGEMPVGPFSPEQLSQLPPTVQLYAPPQLRAAAVAAAHGQPQRRRSS